MLVKIVTLFLIGMAVLAMFGRLRLPHFRASRCPGCGVPRVGRADCPCKGRDA